ncbi:MAG TPA: cytochrome-c oxidase, cbb3-type subunit I [Gammaproteobacteria bacterium]|nr:cytochrome-c oxidase, cbb3-type subunit I [Gammaproteobacteria bacterium]HAU07291.1 cytochrome-c oxidase, cbb3-type subunit I [Gammaproteobacteria bacterium]
MVNLVTPKYNVEIVKWFLYLAVVYFVIGTGIGLWLALELAWPAFNLDNPYLSFGRLRPLHTNIVIFAFGGSTLMAAAYYIVQRTSGVRLWSDNLAWFTFWGWHLMIIGAIITLPLGLTQSKEYAELEWPLDILMAAVWLAYTYNFIMTLSIRRTAHIYVANWFFLAMMIMITYLHIVNSLVIPVAMWKSYSLFSGVQDAMIQWWWGHNAVGFFLTAGFLGIMYYFVPKQANQPVYSYRLSVVHFWGLVFGYVWLGSHHLHYTALPDWTSTLGAAISLAMIIPSWGGALNGLLTLRGAWHRLQSDYILRFFLAALTFYAMATLEGPILASKTVNALSHYTDWTIGHVHSGALGWVAMVSVGAIYHMTEKLWQRPIYSVRLAHWHFWLAMAGLLLYVVAMWIGGITQGLMWRSYNEYGALRYTFIETVMQLFPYYVMRAIGGGLFFTGACLMLLNVSLTIYRTKPVVREHEVRHG